MKKIIVIGSGGHAKSLVDTIEKRGEYEIVGCVVNDGVEWKEGISCPIVGNDDDLEELFAQGIRYAAVGIGYLGKENPRRRLYMRLKEIGFELPVICDYSAIISDRAEIGEGSFVGKGAVVNAGAKIGRCCIINTGAIVEHDCRIGDFSHISVSAILCGSVEVEEDCFIGANATVIQNRRIGSQCIVGAGETVKDNLEKRMKYKTQRDEKIIRGGIELT